MEEIRTLFIHTLCMMKNLLLAATVAVKTGHHDSAGTKIAEDIPIRKVGKLDVTEKLICKVDMSADEEKKRKKRLKCRY